MYQLRSYPTASAFLRDTEELLLQRELENNLVLGICNALAESGDPCSDCVFINVFKEDRIVASSVKTWVKALVCGYDDHAEAMKYVAAYYRDHNIEVQGTFGETYHAEAFSAYYNHQVADAVRLRVHGLSAVTDLPYPPGTFTTVTGDGLEEATDWMLAFEEEAGTEPRKSREQATRELTAKIERQRLYKWVVDGTTVSMAAIMRVTRNVAIIGLVYTPPRYRGEGYATGLVQELSKQMLNSGYARCGLFTDLANPVSNGIYRKIGYQPSVEFTEFNFEVH